MTIDLPLSAHLPPVLRAGPELRLALYQRLSDAREPEEVASIGQELVDRFGQPPPPSRNLLYVVAACACWRPGRRAVDRDGGRPASCCS